MKQIFDKSAKTIMPCNRGFVFALSSGDNGGADTNAYNQHSFDTGITTAISKNAYLGLIYTNHTDFLLNEVNDYFGVKVLFTPNFGMVLIYSDGSARVFDYNCAFKWKGSLKYKGYAPSDAVVVDNSLWCSYPDSNTLIKYNTASMRQEFKISSGVGNELCEPNGLFANEGELVITSANSGKVLSLDLYNYTLRIIHSLDEPAKRYIKVDSNEIVLTNSGIYRL